MHKGVLSLSDGGVAVCVCHAPAGNFLCSAEDLSFNAFKTVLDIDLLGSFNMSKAALPSLKQTRGVIVNISATLHYYRRLSPPRPSPPPPSSSHHSIMFQLHASAAKAGVDVLTRNLACEWGPSGVRVVGVAPGIIAGTEGFSRLGGTDSGDGGEALQQAVPLGRLGCSDDIAAAVVFLCRSPPPPLPPAPCFLTRLPQPRSQLCFRPHARGRRRTVVAPPLGQRRHVMPHA